MISIFLQISGQEQRLARFLPSMPPWKRPTFIYFKKLLFHFSDSEILEKIRIMIKIEKKKENTK